MGRRYESANVRGSCHYSNFFTLLIIIYAILHSGSSCKHLSQLKPSGSSRPGSLNPSRFLRSLTPVVVSIYPASLENKYENSETTMCRVGRPSRGRWLRYVAFIPILCVPLQQQNSCSVSLRPQRDHHPSWCALTTQT